MNLHLLDRLRGESEEKRVSEKILENTSQEAREDMRLRISGTYVMEVDTGWYWDQHKKIVFVPDLIETGKKSVMLSLRLKVVIPTATVKKGSTLLTNVVILAKPNATKEEIENTYRLAKPRIAAFLGSGKNDKIDLTNPEWISENLLADFQRDPPKIIRDHKMKRPVLVTVEDDIVPGTNRPTLRVKSIIPASVTDISISNSAPTVAAPVAESNFKKQAQERKGLSDADPVSAAEVQADAMADTGIDPSSVADIPTVSEEFTG